MKKPTNHKAPELSEEEEIVLLKDKVISEAPEPGSQPLRDNVTFESMPLSSRTKTALSAAHLTVATDIQAAAIPHALAGRDILGAAKTGSGKTLAFVIPMIEKLFVERWSDADGLGAVVITPTRELALQIFDVVRTVGKKHQLSAGLITGGKKEFEEEQARVVRMNILVATPGRLLQHLEQTPGFDASNLQMLILDEADRILDMGFQKQLDAVIEYLPPRQTLLFSATQTKSVKDLARLSLRNPEYLAVHEQDESVTPAQLVQNFVVCRLQDKLDILFSFLKSHLKSKIIVFFSTCSQVRFVYECFRGMQPGIPLSALHGKVKQEKRTLIYLDYTKRKSACLFATDVAARGLDFPSVDWVVQMDAPEDAAMYIHRVGRTARYNSAGKGLLLLLPNEEAFVTKELADAGVPIKKLAVNPKMTISVSNHAAALLVAQPECHQLAKKAFVSYLRSLQMLPHADLYNISSLPIDEFAASMGLPSAPTVPQVPKGDAGREGIRKEKNVNRSLDKLKKQIKEAKEAKRKLREQSLFAGHEEGTVLSAKRKADTSSTVEAKDAEDDLFSVKAIHAWSDNTNEQSEEAALERSKQSKSTKLKIKKELGAKVMREAGSTKVLFDEDGEVAAGLALNFQTSSGLHEEQLQKISEYTRRVKRRVDEGRSEDLLRDKERIREKHRILRNRDKPEKLDGELDHGVTLGGADSESNSGSEDSREDNEENDAASSDDDQDYEDLADQEELALRMMER